MYKQINVNEETYNLLKFYKNTGAISSMSGYLARLIEKDKWRFIKDFNPFADYDEKELFCDEDLSSNSTNTYSYADKCYIPTAIKDIAVKWLKHIIWRNQIMQKDCKTALLLLDICKDIATDDNTTIDIYLLDVLGIYCLLPMEDRHSVSGVSFCKGLGCLKDQLLKEFNLIPCHVRPELEIRRIKAYQQHFIKMLQDDEVIPTSWK